MSYVWHEPTEEELEEILESMEQDMHRSPPKQPWTPFDYAISAALAVLCIGVVWVAWTTFVG